MPDHIFKSNSPDRSTVHLPFTPHKSQKGQAVSEPIHIPVDLKEPARPRGMPTNATGPHFAKSPVPIELRSGIASIPQVRPLPPSVQTVPLLPIQRRTETAPPQPKINGPQPVVQESKLTKSDVEHTSKQKTCFVPVQRQQENKTGLPGSLKAGIEALSGLSMDDVKVHYNSPKPAALNALAYTQGTDIHVASGQEKHLPHEVWHVAQQKRGVVKPTMQTNGAMINDDWRLEQEADVMGMKAVQSKVNDNHGNPLQRQAWLGSSSQVIQRRTNVKLDGEEDLSPGDDIHTVQHDRNAVSAASRNTARGYEWTAVPGGVVCNHSVSYDRLLLALLDHAQFESVKDYVLMLYNLCQGLYAGGLAIPAGHTNVANALHNGNDVDRDDYNRALNYLIYKICDYPGNLFFWPNKTGGDPDYPVGIVAPPVGWAAVAGLDLTGATTTTRLQNAEAYIQQFINL